LLARVHGISVAGEALVALALAGSLFFKVDPAEGREKVLLGLLLTIAPFGLVAPLIGPMIDRVRGGHRVVVLATMVSRALLAVAMVVAIAQDSVALFPEAFLMLVLAKTYQVSKAALVPSVVQSDAELVEANSKLQVISGLVTIGVGAPGLVLAWISPALVIAAAAVCFVVGAIAAVALPQAVPAAGSVNDPASAADGAAPGYSAMEAERTELRSGAVVSAGAVMLALRAIVGLTTFLVAFELRGAAPSLTERAALATMRVAEQFSPRYQEPSIGSPTWYFGIVVVLGVLGGLGGAALAPRVRAAVSEELMLLGAVAVVAIGSLMATQLDGLAALSLLTVVVSVCASAGKQAFDAVIQRDAPDANRGRLFARFEARFQLAWVLGALPPVAFRLPSTVGAAFVAVIALTALLVGVLGVDRVTDAVRTSQATAKAELRRRRSG